MAYEDENAAVPAMRVLVDAKEAGPSEGVPGVQEPEVGQEQTMKCAVCGRPCGARCPYCSAYVHHSYGRFPGDDCGLKHEAKCPKAKEARLGPKVPPPAAAIAPLKKPVYDTVTLKIRDVKGRSRGRRKKARAHRC